MSKLKAQSNQAINPARLRVGIFLILLWWLPLWLFAPFIANKVGAKTSTVTITVVILQTIIGIIGVYVAGKQTAEIIKSTPKKHVLSKIWQIILHGNLNLN
ncbi:hypothetical protein EB118_05090 [bacterium]|nr:hypothetical protein [bacterium]NBX98616.1 hypothetical protein [bacterium]NDC94248.1 hypothetical protein [bacterium]NDD84590.1 hypothetical protein [bacterium]NDG29459.1 hypothetical protein [bacterium]